MGPDIKRENNFDEEEVAEAAVAGRGENIVVIYSAGFTSYLGVHMGVDGDQEESTFSKKCFVRGICN